MIVRVKLFAAARELAGVSEMTLDVPGGAKLDDVERALLKKVPTLERVVSHARWAVNAEFALPASSITENSEIALIPPVSGG
jgi:molybdopterin converting factor subunit 1